MCCAYDTSLTWKPAQPTARPLVRRVEGRGEAGLAKDGRERRTLERVAGRMNATMRACGEQPAVALFESRRRGWAQQDQYRMPPMHTVFEAVGASIYAMEWTSDPLRVEEHVAAPVGVGTMAPRAVTGRLEPGHELEPPSEWLFGYKTQLQRLFELMFVIDYGFPARPIAGPVFGPMLIPRDCSMGRCYHDLLLPPSSKAG
ncbi:hypothetical protein VTK26DRAFT_8019 [Humicola hyalothermophila]